MSLPKVVSRGEWLAARRELLAREKEMTRRRDALSTARRELPMVKVDTAYMFTGPDGERSLTELFEGRRQLIVQHFMFDPSWDEGCPSCTAASDEISDGLLAHLDQAELEARDMGWMTEGSSEQPGYSVFLSVGDEIFHTYSVYARGTEMLGGSYYFLDMTALGRQEEWEEPKGRASGARAAIPDFSA